MNCFYYTIHLSIAMSMSPDQLWNAALGELELELSKANFITWFDHTFILSKEEGKVTIGVPSAFYKSWLEKQYHQSILKALRRISDEDIRIVTYQVSSRQQKAQQDKIQQTTPAAHPIEPVVTPHQPQSVSPVSAASMQEPVAPAVQKHQQSSTPQPVENDRGLNPRYTFEHFVVGKKNELAHAACLAVVERLGYVYNPLFIYGGVGLGKTHLMQAVGHAVVERYPNKKILYVTCETFTNEYIKAVGEGRATLFKEKYRSVDLLMVDDIQFLAGKEGTQEEFFHTFNYLHQLNKQVILTSDRPPRGIPSLEHRLLSRFEGGMIVDVSLPDLETRIAIVAQKCREKNYPLPQEIAQFIATTIQNNIRELEGVINRIIAYHDLHKINPSVDSVKLVMSSFSQAPKRGAVTTKKILSTVSEFFEVDPKDIVGNSRKKELVVPRQIAMYLMREEVHASYPNIGQELGGRDHTTAMHACQKITRLADEDEKIGNDISMIKERLYNQ